MLDMRASFVPVRASIVGLLALVFTAGLTTGCNPNSIGRLCVDPTNTSVSSGGKIVSPALECPSRLCLVEPSQTMGSISTCTAECSSNSDCEAETKEYCASGFACAVATDVGSFCCKKVCICRDSLTAGFNIDDSNPPKIVTPFECDPKVNSNITCQNVK